MSRPETLLKKRDSSYVISFVYYNFIQNSYSTEHLRVAGSVGFPGRLIEFAHGLLQTNP